MNRIAFLLLIAGIASGGYAPAQQASIFPMLDTAQKRIRITAELSDHATVLIQYAQPEDYNGGEELARIIGIANEHYRALKDSFKNDFSQKVLKIKLPPTEAVIQMRFSENTDDEKNIAYKDGSYYQLKTQKDTILVIKEGKLRHRPVALSNDSLDMLHRVSYTFILKDIGEIGVLAADHSKVDSASSKIDSLIVKFPKKGIGKYETLSIGFDKNNTLFQPVKSSAFLNHLYTNEVLGIAYLNRKAALTIDLGAGYIQNKLSKNALFVGMNYSLIMMSAFPVTQSNFYHSFSLEFGIADFSKGYRSRRMAIGIGYFTNNTYRKNVDVLPEMMRLYLEFPVYKHLSAGLDIYSNLKWGDNGARYQGIIGGYLKIGI